MTVASVALTLAVVTAAMTTVMACSSDGSSDDVDLTIGDAGDSTSDARIADDSPDAPPADDAETNDASADADAVAPERTCSNGGFCYSDVPTGQVLRDVWSDGAGGAFAISDQGNILRFDGKEWSIQYANTATDVRLFSVWGSAPTDVWVGGYRVALHGQGTSADALTWTAIPLDSLSPTAGAISIYGTGASDVYAAAGPNVLHYAGAETGWTIDPVTTTVAGNTTEVWGRVGTNDVWLSTTDNAKKTVLYRRSVDGDGVVVWTAVRGVSEVSIPSLTRPCATAGEPRRGWMSDDDSVWLVGTRINFTATNVCYYLFHGTESADAGAYSFTGAPFNDAYFRLNDVWGSGPDDVWLAGDFGVLQHWDGKAWSAAEIALDTLPLKKNLNAVFGRGPNDIWVVGDGVAFHKGAP